MSDTNSLVWGPTFEEMLHPDKVEPHFRLRGRQVRELDPLDKANLFNICWRNVEGAIRHEVLPRELTGVDANIVVLCAREFPSGSHKVGAAYSVLVERQLSGEVVPWKQRLLWPSTGNYGIGGAWVGGRMGYRSLVVLPQGMSPERFRLLESYGAEVVKTPGGESNVREIYEAVRQLKASDPEGLCVLNQFDSMGNYRFNNNVTGNTLVELAAELRAQGIGGGQIDAFCSAMGSAGTIAAGDRLKQVWPEARVVGLEPIQCSTLYNAGYGSHEIQGIGDNHVTWIHNVWNMDAIACVDDQECLKGLQVLAEEAGWKAMTRHFAVPEAAVRRLSTLFGISGVCNVLGAIKIAKFYQLDRRSVVATIATDGLDRYLSVVCNLDQKYGRMDEAEAMSRVASIFHGQRTDWIKEGTLDMRRQWHNLKYYTWVEQQGKSVAELDAQRDPEWWLREQARVAEIDAALRQARAASY